MASGFSSRAFCRKGAKSGLRMGTRIEPLTLPPFNSKRSLNETSASMPGP